MSGYVHMIKCPKKLEALESPRAGVTGDCEPPYMVPSSERTVKPLSHLFSPIPRVSAWCTNSRRHQGNGVGEAYPKYWELYNVLEVPWALGEYPTKCARMSYIPSQGTSESAKGEGYEQLLKKMLRIVESKQICIKLLGDFRSTFLYTLDNSHILLENE